MAGIQQAVNSLTGAYGTIAGRVGIYNELVGKNQELIKKQSELFKDYVKSQNENFDLKAKTGDENTLKKLSDLYDIQTQTGKKLMTAEQEKAAMRYRANQNSHASKRAMLDILYQQTTEETPFLKKDNEGGK